MIAVLLLLSYLGNVSSSDVLEISILVAFCEISKETRGREQTFTECLPLPFSHMGRLRLKEVKSFSQGLLL